MKIIILIFFTFAASLSFASFKKGNGGNAIYCSQQDKWEILDHYEIQPILRLTPNPNITDDNFDEKKTCQICGKSGCCYKQMNANSYLCWSCHMDLSN